MTHITGFHIKCHTYALTGISLSQQQRVGAAIVSGIEEGVGEVGKFHAACRRDEHNHSDGTLRGRVQLRPAQLHIVGGIGHVEGWRDEHVGATQICHPGTRRLKGRQVRPAAAVAVGREVLDPRHRAHRAAAHIGDGHGGVGAIGIADDDGDGVGTAGGIHQIKHALSVKAADNPRGVEQRRVPGAGQPIVVALDKGGSVDHLVAVLDGGSRHRDHRHVGLAHRDIVDAEAL